MKSQFNGELPPEKKIQLNTIIIYNLSGDHDYNLSDLLCMYLLHAFPLLCEISQQENTDHFVFGSFGINAKEPLQS